MAGPSSVFVHLHISVIETFVLHCVWLSLFVGNYPARILAFLQRYLVWKILSSLILLDMFVLCITYEQIIAKVFGVED